MLNPNQSEHQTPSRFNRANHPAPLRAEFYEGDEITIGMKVHKANAAVVGINNITHSRGVIAGPMDNIPDVGIGGRSNARGNVGVYGYSKDGVGVYCKSESFGALHAETSSTESAASTAIQMNADSPTAAFFARHAGNGTAAIFEGHVFISGNLVVQGNGFMSLLHRVENLEASLQLCQNRIQGLEGSLQQTTMRLQALETKVSFL